MRNIGFGTLVGAACWAIFGATSCGGAAASNRPSDGPRDPEGLALTDATSSAKRMITGFRQGDTGNCASIGAIKAAIHEYGDNLFVSRSVSTDGSVTVTMRDQRVVVLSPSEQSASAALSHFKSGTDPGLLTHGVELFGVMVKRLQEDRHVPSFDAAAAELNDGEYFKDMPTYLGLTNDVIAMKGNGFTRWLTKTKFVRHHNSCVAASGGHAWFVSHGFADDHGRVVPFNSIVSSVFALKAGNAYCLDSGT